MIGGSARHIANSSLGWGWSLEITSVFGKTRGLEMSLWLVWFLNPDRQIENSELARIYLS